MKNYLKYIILLLAYACGNKQASKTEESNSDDVRTETASLVILGTIQDGGSPHIGCERDCCSSLFDKPDNNRQVVSLGLFDADTKKKYLFDASPDMPRQLKALKNYVHKSKEEIPEGIFLTHAHIGHYAGLMYLGKEAMGAKLATVYAMPKMKTFLETNGPWSQLVSSGNINLKQIENNQSISLSNKIKVTPILVPHRDEFSETVGYLIKGPKKSALFIPDIDKWEKWDRNIIEEIKKVDYAFLDATFFSGKELNNRDMSQIPHPFIVESIKKFENLTASERQKIIFIHFNHTNPVINLESVETMEVLKKGFRIGRINDSFEL
ncbi:MBL fold metallo-hydrolase [Mariniflexile sp.]|uniref:MBL fold metallo-hydrolase n=1 Tax=Mariniflexile sp. TaxID=1979402 RepID=UPI0035699E7B